MRKFKSILFAFMAILLLGAKPSVIFAEETPETGSLVLTLQDDDKQPVVGGTITMTKVADFSEEDGNLAWTLVEAIDPARTPVENPEDRQTIKDLKEKVKAAGIEGITVDVDQEGKAAFTDLPLGLYLVTQETPAPTYNPITSFLIGIPEINEDGTRNYNLDAFPKTKIHHPRKPNTATETKLMFYVGLLLTSVVLLIMAFKLKKSSNSRV